MNSPSGNIVKHCYIKYKGHHMVIDLGVIWKGFIRWALSLYLF